MGQYRLQAEELADNLVSTSHSQVAVERGKSRFLVYSRHTGRRHRAKYQLALFA